MNFKIKFYLKKKFLKLFLFIDIYENFEYFNQLLHKTYQNLNYYPK